MAIWEGSLMLVMEGRVGLLLLRSGRPSMQAAMAETEELPTTLRVAGEAPGPPVTVETALPAALVEEVPERLEEPRAGPRTTQGRPPEGAAVAEIVRAGKARTGRFGSASDRSPCLLQT